MRRAPIMLLCVSIALTAVACGRVTQPAANEVGLTGVPSDVPPELRGEWSEAPTLVRWDGGPPVWNIPFDVTQDVIIEAKLGSSPEARAALGMPDECLEYENGEGPIFTAPWKTCALPALAALGADEAALEFLDATGTTVYAAEGTGEVKVAWALNWEVWGNQDDMFFTYVFTPSGYYLEPFRRDSWAPYAQAVLAAYTDEDYDELRSLFPGRSTAEPYVTWPLSLADEYGDVYGVPEPYDDGWKVPVTMYVTQPTECHACGTEFGVLISLDFSSSGEPLSARYLGYCWFPDQHAWMNGDGGRRTASIVAATDALTERLPTCPGSAAPETPIASTQ